MKSHRKMDRKTDMRMTGGSLLDYLQEKTVSGKDKMKLMSGIAMGMYHLHLENVVSFLNFVSHF
jgi:hypothetical protein